LKIPRGYIFLEQSTFRPIKSVLKQSKSHGKGGVNGHS
jgi:hypothetical protein